MDALVPAFVAALLAAVADKPARLAALLGTRGGLAAVILGIGCGHALAIVISVAGAHLIAPLMTPDARSLLLAIALLLAGLCGLWRRRAPPGERGTGFVAAAAGSFVGGDAVAFLAFAFAVKGSTLALAGAGALAGAMVPAVIAAGAGRDWERVPLAVIGRMGGCVLILAGLIVGLGGLRLI